MITPLFSEINWDSGWIKNYESIWSIYNKIKLANSISNREICRMLITNEDKFLSVIRNNQSSILFSNFDEKQTSLVLNFNLIKYQQQLNESILNNIRANYKEVKFFFRNDLAICPICKQQSYHSIFHQLVLLDYCPFHNQKLLYLNCIDIMLDDSYDSIFNIDSTYNSYTKLRNGWKNYSDSENIIDNNLKTYLNTRLNPLKKKKDIYFDNAFLSSNNKIAKFISLLNTGNSQDLEHKMITLKSPPVHTSNKTFDITSFQDINKLYNTTNNTFRSIARNIRKRVLRKHNHCLKKYIKHHPSEICKLAFAYVNWRKFVEGRNNIWEIDNGPRKKDSYHLFTIVSKQDNEYLFNLFSLIFNQIDKDLWKESLVHWFINRLLSIFLISHYNKWNEIATTTDSVNYSYHKCPFSYDHLPPYIIEITNDLNCLIKIHYWY